MVEFGSVENVHKQTGTAQKVFNWTFNSGELNIDFWFLWNITILFNNALNVVHWYSIILRIADFKSPAFVDNCCTLILSIWILIQQTFDSVDRHKNKIKNTKRYTNGNKTTVFAIALMLNTSLFETYVETNHAMKRKYYDTRTGNYCNCMHISPSHLFADTNKNLKINHTMTIEKKLQWLYLQ